MADLGFKGVGVGFGVLRNSGRATGILGGAHYFRMGSEKGSPSPDPQPMSTKPPHLADDTPLRMLLPELSNCAA